MGQTWNGDLVHDAGNVLSDIGGFFSGPPGDPGRIRQVAAQVESLRGRFDADRRALDEAVNELTTSWRGDGATQFAATWSGGGGGPAPARVLHDASEQLRTFSTQLYDYADQLEHAQHEHWIELGIMAALTVVNVAQLGADPATEAAEIGEGTAMAVGTSFALTDVGTLALQGAFVGLGSDVIAQLGADVWDRMDTRFDLTGDHAVALLDPREAALSAAGGAASFAAAGTVGRSPNSSAGSSSAA
ncbi:MAG: WXG100 family type VII secretion target [Candidatus Dormibacteraeota bacterium]|nr:WXG100 family type VII secretion target [Candidatus Dormibacteraeota bacterium]